MVRLASVMIQAVGTSESYQVAAHNYTKDDKAFWARFNLFSFFAVESITIANWTIATLIMADSNDAFERFLDWLNAIWNEKLDSCEKKNFKLNRYVLKTYTRLRVECNTCICKFWEITLNCMKFKYNKSWRKKNYKMNHKKDFYWKLIRN